MVRSSWALLAFVDGTVDSIGGHGTTPRRCLPVVSAMYFRLACDVIFVHDSKQRKKGLVLLRPRCDDDTGPRLCRNRVPRDPDRRRELLAGGIRAPKADNSGACLRLTFLFIRLYVACKMYR